MVKTTTRSTVVGAFEDRAHAQDAIRELKDRGFTEQQIGLISHRSEQTSSGEVKDVAEGSYAAEGAMTGLAVGAGVGALWGLGIAAGMLPAIGPVIAGGTLASILASAATGAAVAGVGGALVGMGVPEDEAKYYEGEFKAGRTLVTVQAGSQAAEVESIMRNHGGYDIRTKDSYQGSDEYRQKVATTSATMATPMASTYTGTPVSSQSCPTTPTTSHSSASRTSDAANIQLKEEKLNVKKEVHQAGEVRVRKEVVTEHRSIDVPVEREEIVIERRSPSSSTRADSNIRPGEEIRIPVKEEEVRVQKTPVVKEEVNIRKQKIQETKRVDADVKHEELRVDEQGKTHVRKS